jgi:hypothetical protein
MDIQNEVSAIARKALAELAPVAVEANKRGTVQLKVGARHRRLDVVWAGDGWPSDIRRLVPDGPWSRSMVVVARRLTRSSVSWLREHDANWIDGTGLARIVSPDGLLVLREPLEPAAISAGETQRVSWSNVQKDVAEVLLSKRDVPRAAEIAKETGWSPIAVAKALSTFDREGWTAKSGAARGPGATRRLVEPRRLLDAWSEAMVGERRTTILAHATFSNAIDFFNTRLSQPLSKLKAQWAVSGWAGSQLVAPSVTLSPTLQLYVDASTFDTRLLTLLQGSEIRVVTEGARIEFWRARPVVFAEARRYPTVVADAPRVYADLLRLGGRANEAAQEIREQLIDY